MAESITPNNTAASTSTEASISTAASINNNNSSSSSPATSASVSASASAVTMTITEEPQPAAATQTQNLNDGVLRLTLQDRVGIRWDETVVDNEGMGRKSSKRCCIFHKPRAFGESSTDTSDYDSDGKYGSGHHHKKIAHKKNLHNKKVPDHLRFHA